MIIRKQEQRKLRSAHGKVFFKYINDYIHLGFVRKKNHDNDGGRRLYFHTFSLKQPLKFRH